MFMLSTDLVLKVYTIDGFNEAHTPGPKLTSSLCLFIVWLK